MKTPLLLSAALLFACAAPALAQNSPTLAAEGPVRELERFRERQSFTLAPATPLRSGDAVPELYPGENADVGPQFLAVPRVRPTWWEAAVDVQYLYTSNMFLTEKGNTDTGLLISTVQAGIAPPAFDLAGGKLSLRAGYRHQRYMYGLDDTSNQLNNFDFDVSTIYLGARYIFAENWAAFVGLDHNRLLSHEEDWHEFYSELLPTWGMERQVQFGERHALTLAYIGAGHFTHTDPTPVSNFNDRTDSILSAIWTSQLVRNVVLQPYYRFQHTHYCENSDRNDVYHTVGVALAWAFHERASIRVFSNWELRDSNDPIVTDYEKFDTGGGVSVSLKF